MRAALGIVLLLAATPARAQREDDGADRVPDFALLDQRGRSHELSRTEAAVVVIFVTGNGCPVARQSIATLKDLSRTYAARGVVFWLLDAQPQDDRASIQKEAEEFDVGRLPILHDEAQIVARRLGIRHTGEAIAISTRDGQVFYRGAIDDRTGPGAQRARATDHYLQAALEERLAGKAVARPRVPALGCAVTFEAERPISYAREVAPLITAHCLPCHQGDQRELPAFTSYQRLHATAGALKRVLLERRMPPAAPDPHAGLALAGPGALAPADQQRIWRWLEQGAPRDGDDDPLARTPPRQGMAPLGEPDLRIMARGKQRALAVFEGHTGIWVRAIAIRPARPNAIAQVIARWHEGGDAVFARWSPGLVAQPYPAGTGKWVGPGTAFDLEIRRPAGAASEDEDVELGLYLARELPAMTYQELEVATRDLSIPPGEPEARGFALYRFPRPALLFELAPHMNRRGAWFEFEALYPDGTREVLLSVPTFDWRWPGTYRLATPRRIPAGTWLLESAGYDNSARNPFNPAPGRRVAGGDGPEDETLSGTIGLVEPPPPTALHRRGRVAR
jgi:peroxiredoxin